jgi:hypothetical protein
LFYHENNLIVTDETPTPAELKVLHKTIKKIEEDTERFSFNTCISAFMVCVNELTDLKCHKKEILSPLLILLTPYAPHVACELWETLKVFPPTKIRMDLFLMQLSLNGIKNIWKKRQRISGLCKWQTADYHRDRSFCTAAGSRKYCITQ